MLDKMFRGKFVEDFFSNVDETENLHNRRIKVIKHRDSEGCEDCGYPLWTHDKDGVQGGGHMTYNYVCPSKSNLFE